MLSVFLANVIMLGVFLLSVLLVNVIMLSILLLNVIIQCLIADFAYACRDAECLVQNVAMHAVMLSLLMP
jgi:hypothetical protein